ncbi:MAG TPA: 2-hydroxyacyl-CoA dehydratase family protein [Victivallales bacterium]|nr:2-hydroxyacyl-CoA dehydratase family protein [Victivallales bacterium]HPO90094.1 2-hydroxyacyl-CoA dehydratase family protein [Victivallales bacterium]HRR05877.1 2-hydroxyacyl-CoA dehydratase family protein [Victivallales bacterium]HRR28442.1 2-hydroxyacyl-CoA dehydratase family protein [Victivallales bacterium]HRU00694.1 2-hydroxyacyl-CoA dehydratase family protein [Victivallales bacterium]
MEHSQYSGRYNLEPRSNTNPKIFQKINSIITEQLNIQSDLTTRPENISFFEEIIRNPIQTINLPLIGTFCNMIPFEIIRAMGAHPIRMGCGNPSAVSVGEEIIPGDVCPLVKASVGMSLIEGSIISKVLAFIIPTSCDAKKKLGDVLSDFKPVFMLNLPPEQNAYLYLKSAEKELKRMITFLEKNLGLKLNRKKLSNEIKSANRKTKIFRHIQELRNSHPYLLSIRDLFLIVQSSFFRQDEFWLREVEKVYAWLESKSKKERAEKFPKKRVILTGAPLIFPNFKILNVIEESGAEVVADTLCTGVHSCFDPIVVDEGWTGALLRSLAMKYVFASICPCFISQDSKLNRIIDLVREFKADGVINHALRLCQLCDMENYRTHQILRKNQIPILDVRTDYSLEDTEQLRVRIEAFLETLP